MISEVESERMRMGRLGCHSMSDFGTGLVPSSQPKARRVANGGDLEKAPFFFGAANGQKTRVKEGKRDQ